MDYKNLFILESLSLRTVLDIDPFWKCCWWPLLCLYQVSSPLTVFHLFDLSLLFHCFHTFYFHWIFYLLIKSLCTGLRCYFRFLCEINACLMDFPPTRESDLMILFTLLFITLLEKLILPTYCIWHCSRVWKTQCACHYVYCFFNQPYFFVLYCVDLFKLTNVIVSTINMFLRYNLVMLSTYAMSTISQWHQWLFCVSYWKVVF